MFGIWASFAVILLFFFRDQPLAGLCEAEERVSCELPAAFSGFHLLSHICVAKHLKCISKLFTNFGIFILKNSWAFEATGLFQDFHWSRCCDS